jgi:hypothetical protein
MIVGAAVLASAGATASATPIRHHHIGAEAVSARDYRGWVGYLAAGPRVWATVHDPEVTLAARQAIHRALQVSDPLSNPWIQYLEWRRDLDPARFDHWHPRLGPQLAQLLPVPTTPSTSVTSVSQPQTTTPAQPQTITPGPPPNQQIIPPVVTPPAIQTPEPSALSISLLLLGAGAWWRRRAHRATRPNRN